MDRRRPRGSCNDELALGKAAAWAWFQHGSEGKPIVPEFDIRRACHAPYKPSRYKLEAMKKIDKISEEDHMEGLKSPSAVESASDNSLLDPYEIESIARKLDQLIESSGDKDKINKGFLVGDVLGTKKVKRGGRSSNSKLENRAQCSNSQPLKLQAPSLVGDIRRQETVPLLNERKKKSKKSRGFWHRHAAICGRNEDVLNTKRDSVASRQRPEKGGYVPVEVVKVANCRPRATLFL